MLKTKNLILGEWGTIMKYIFLSLTAVIIFVLSFLPGGCDLCDQDNQTSTTTSFQIDNGTPEKELLSLLNAQTYEYYRHGTLPITDDIEIVGKITISTEQLEVPQDWVEHFHGDCRVHVGFADYYVSNIDGIELSANYMAMEASSFSIEPAVLTLTDVKLRFRHLIVNTHPGGIKTIRQ
jgi:hypothetical protein